MYIVSKERGLWDRFAIAAWIYRSNKLARDFDYSGGFRGVQRTAPPLSSENFAKKGNNNALWGWNPPSKTKTTPDLPYWFTSRVKDLDGSEKRRNFSLDDRNIITYRIPILLEKSNENTRSWTYRSIYFSLLILSQSESSDAFYHVY